MIRKLLIGFCLAVAATIIAWFLIPNSTYIEDALGILMATFVTTMVVSVIAQYVIWRRRT